MVYTNTAVAGYFSVIIIKFSKIPLGSFFLPTVMHFLPQTNLHKAILFLIVYYHSRVDNGDFGTRKYSLYTPVCCM